MLRASYNRIQDLAGRLITAQEAERARIAAICTTSRSSTWWPLSEMATRSSVCRAMSRLLRSLGMDTDMFTSGDEFIKHLETVRAFHPDCVRLDVKMPGLNGLEVQGLLVRSENFLPVIFVTAHDEASLRERALRAGAVAFPAQAVQGRSVCQNTL